MQKKEKITCNTKQLIGLFGFDISSTHFVWHVSAHCVAGKLASVFPLSKFNLWPSTLFSSLLKFYFVGPKCCFLSCLEVCDPIFSRTVGGFWDLSHYLLKARLSCQLGMFQKYCNPQPSVARASIVDRQLNKTHANLVFGVLSWVICWVFGTVFLLFSGFKDASSNFEKYSFVQTPPCLKI